MNKADVINLLHQYREEIDSTGSAFWDRIDEKYAQLLSHDWEEKLKAFLEGLEVENIDKLMAEAEVKTYRKFGAYMASEIKQRIK